MHTHTHTHTHTSLALLLWHTWCRSLERKRAWVPHVTKTHGRDVHGPIPSGDPVDCVLVSFVVSGSNVKANTCAHALWPAAWPAVYAYLFTELISHQPGTSTSTTKRGSLPC